MKMTDREILDRASEILEKKATYTTTVTSPIIASAFLRAKLYDRGREVFAVMFLDNAHHLIKYEEMFLGTIDSAVIHPREVARSALMHNAAAVVFAHNHPSGDASPSRADEVITKKLVKCLDLFDIRVLDHLVIGKGETTSFAEKGLL